MLAVAIVLGAFGEASAVGEARAAGEARAVAVSTALAPDHAGTASTESATCPLKASSVSPSGDAWAFTQAGPPSTPHPGITSSYTHGRGTWTDGHGSGTICTEDSATGHPSHELVLAVAGSSRISPRITHMGRLGVGLALKVTVSASDDEACPVGTRGTVTLFASYYQEHHDSLQLRFSGGCGSYDYTYSGSQLHMLIADDGHQVNSA